jgi:hypothetical protein
MMPSLGVRGIVCLQNHASFKPDDCKKQAISKKERGREECGLELVRIIS